MALPLKIVRRFAELSTEEKIWVITHPLRAYKVWKISNKVRHLADSMMKDPDLDGDFAGGQVDALRHIIWMVLLTRKWGPDFARHIGQMHERANKLDFQKGRLEEYLLPDATSMMMDLLNNEIGIELGQKLPDVSIDSLVQHVKKLILEGKAWVIKKDKNGNFLDINGKIIPKSQWLGKWNTPKVLVKSDFRKGIDSLNNNRRKKNHKH